jgi:hypothetical protein
VSAGLERAALARGQWICHEILRKRKL